MLTVLIIVALSAPLMVGLILYFRYSEHSTEAAEARRDARAAQERVDRLTEALSRKAGVDLILPAPPLPKLEPASTFFDRKKQPQVRIYKGEPQ